MFGVDDGGRPWYRNFAEPRVPARSKDPYRPVNALKQPSLWSMAVRVFILSTPPRNPSTSPQIFLHHERKPAVIFVSRSIFLLIFLLHLLLRRFPLHSIRSGLLASYSAPLSSQTNYTFKMPGVVSPPTQPLHTHTQPPPPTRSA